MTGAQEWLTGVSRKEPEHRQDGHKFQEENIKIDWKVKAIRKKTHGCRSGVLEWEYEHRRDGEEFQEENRGALGKFRSFKKRTWTYEEGPKVLVDIWPPESTKPGHSLLTQLQSHVPISLMTIPRREEQGSKLFVHHFSLHHFFPPLLFITHLHHLSLSLLGKNYFLRKITKFLFHW